MKVGNTIIHYDLCGVCIVLVRITEALILSKFPCFSSCKKGQRTQEFWIFLNVLEMLCHQDELYSGLLGLSSFEIVTF